MKASNWDLLVVNLLALYLGMYMESHVLLLLEHILDPYIDTLKALMMATLMNYCLDTHLDVLVVK